jgi:hypothetical protein
VRTEGDKLDDTSKGKFTDVVSANVDVSGLFMVDWICGHGHNRQIVFMEVGRAFWGDAEILKDSTDVHDFFAAFAGGHVFSFRKVRQNPVDVASS